MISVEGMPLEINMSRDVSTASNYSFLLSPTSTNSTTFTPTNPLSRRLLNSITRNGRRIKRELWPSVASACSFLSYVALLCSIWPGRTLYFLSSRNSACSRLIDSSDSIWSWLSYPTYSLKHIPIISSSIRPTSCGLFMPLGSIKGKSTVMKTSSWPWRLSISHGFVTSEPGSHLCDTSCASIRQSQKTGQRSRHHDCPWLLEHWGMGKSTS